MVHASWIFCFIVVSALGAVRGESRVYMSGMQNSTNSTRYAPQAVVNVAVNPMRTAISYPSGWSSRSSGTLETSCSCVFSPESSSVSLAVQQPSKHSVVTLPVPVSMPPTGQQTLTKRPLFANSTRGQGVVMETGHIPGPTSEVIISEATYAKPLWYSLTFALLLSI
ncbi:hypothetical protein EV126DRAFT_176913 [Verticillium dahliae]|nr:hypothetical protein EV126DRAFT_176913 [Verticillium dahliae]